MILDLVKSLGLGSLIGVFIGSRITARQRSGELLRNIESANYRETVGAYRELRETLQKVRSLASTISVYASALQHTDKEVDPRIESYLKSDIKDALTELRELHKNALSRQVADFGLHFDGRVQRNAMFIEVAARMIIVNGEIHLSDPNLVPIDIIASDAAKLDEAIKALSTIWGQWKKEMEPKLAGVVNRPRVWRRIAFGRTANGKQA
ncbi:hypothetical protein ACFPM7_26870 [Actinokineospora guangxiensis]|uniref:Uncharacterized protein n=1 Tax=Actinokineospora guangxiensis TaxID=1490288 RepID=A0ABW0ETE8_9PSEU